MVKETGDNLDQFLMMLTQLTVYMKEKKRLRLPCSKRQKTGWRRSWNTFMSRYQVLRRKRRMTQLIVHYTIPMNDIFNLFSTILPENLEVFYSTLPCQP